MELSNRLKALADMVTEGNIVADIGCDHGYVSIYLIEKNMSPKVVAMDVNQGPLERAKEHIAKYAMLDVIDVRISDGIRALEIVEQEEKEGRVLEVDTLFIAGMGGRLIQKILLDSMEKVKLAKELILQPQSEIEYVRKFLRDYGFTITEENMIYEEGKYYPMMRVISNKNLLNEEAVIGGELLDCEQGIDREVRGVELQDKFGAYLLRDRHPILLQYLTHEKEKYQQIIEQLESGSKLMDARAIRVKELKRKVYVIHCALSYFST